MACSFTTWTWDMHQETTLELILSLRTVIPYDSRRNRSPQSTVQNALPSLGLSSRSMSRRTPTLGPGATQGRATVSSQESIRIARTVFGGRCEVKMS